TLNMREDDSDFWLNTLMEVSGAGAALENATRQLEPDIREMEETIYPKILELERMDSNWQRAKQMYTDAQRRHLEQNGYAFLEPDQLALIYNSP
ncbi:CRE-MLTN-13 protein, partial [Aphelenchoides avenae]